MILGPGTSFGEIALLGVGAYELAHCQYQGNDSLVFMTLGLAPDLAKLLSWEPGI